MKRIKLLTPIFTTAIVAATICPITSCSKSELLDYSNASNWMIKEEYGTDAVDVFYLYPTVSGDMERDVTIVDDAFKQDAYTKTAINIKCLDPITNIYAPYYHQLTSGAIAKCLLQQICTIWLRIINTLNKMYLTHLITILHIIIKVNHTF